MFCILCNWLVRSGNLLDLNMDCNCLQACPLPVCITETLQIGIVQPGLTGLVVRFECEATGRVLELPPTDPQADGLLVVDVSDVFNFFSTNLPLKMSVLYGEENTCQVVPVETPTETFECVILRFVNGITGNAAIAIEGESIELLRFTANPSGRGFNIGFPAIFTGNFTMDWGDGSEGVIYSGAPNTHSYVEEGPKQCAATGDFSGMQSIDLANAVISSFTLPPTNGVNNLLLNGNTLTTVQVSNVLYNLSKNSVSNGTVNVSGQTPAAPLNELGAVGKSALVARGWTVLNDV